MPTDGLSSRAGHLCCGNPHLGGRRWRGKPRGGWDRRARGLSSGVGSFRRGLSNDFAAFLAKAPSSRSTVFAGLFHRRARQGSVGDANGGVYRWAVTPTDVSPLPMLRAPDAPTRKRGRRYAQGCTQVCAGPSRCISSPRSGPYRPRRHSRNRRGAGYRDWGSPMGGLQEGERGVGARTPKPISGCPAVRMAKAGAWVQSRS
jgi:hypothetical protein